MQVMFVRLPQSGGTASARQVIFKKKLACNLIVRAHALRISSNELPTEHSGMETAANDSGVSDVCANDRKKKFETARNNWRNFIFKEKKAALQIGTSRGKRNRN